MNDWLVMFVPGRVVVVVVLLRVALIDGPEKMHVTSVERVIDSQLGD